MKTKQIEIPEITCEGCKSRDRIIQSLADEVDRLSSQEEISTSVIRQIFLGTDDRRVTVVTEFNQV